MAAGIPTGLTPAQGRRFGVTVGAAFLVLAVFVGWHGHPNAGAVLGALGGTLSLAGLLVPSTLGPVERAWMRLAHVISKVTTPIVLGAMYLLVLTPVGLARRALGGNPLVHQPKDASFWKSGPQGHRRGNLTRQF